MANQKSGRILRIIFQSVISGGMLVYGFLFIASTTLPNSFGLLGFIFTMLIAYAGLIFIWIRSFSRNLRKWEAITYNILNVVLVITIFVAARMLLEVSEEIFQLQNPYDPDLEFDAWDEYYETYEYLNMGSYIWNVFFGFISTIETIVLSTLSMIFSLKSSNNHIANSVKPNIVEDVVIEKEEIEEEAEKEEIKEKPKAVKKAKEEAEIKFCSNCGKSLDKGAKFCKFCGKEIK